MNGSGCRLGLRREWRVYRPTEDRCHHWVGAPYPPAGKDPIMPGGADSAFHCRRGAKGYQTKQVVAAVGAGVGPAIGGEAAGAEGVNDHVHASFLRKLTPQAVGVLKAFARPVHLESEGVAGFIKQPRAEYAPVHPRAHGALPRYRSRPVAPARIPLSCRRRAKTAVRYRR